MTYSGHSGDRGSAGAMSFSSVHSSPHAVHEGRSMLCASVCVWVRACVCACVCVRVRLCVCMYSQEQTGWKWPFIFDETYHLPRASLVAQLVKNPPAMQETPIQFLGQKDSPGEAIGYPLQLGLRWWLKR